MSRHRFPCRSGQGSCSLSGRRSHAPGVVEPSGSSMTCHHSVMPTDQYHEPPDDLSDEIRTFARMIASLQEEAEAIGWYEQRMSVEKDDQARKIMEDAQQEEFLHFAMSLEYLSRRKEKWRIALQKILFKDGDIVENKEKAEDAVED
jgi:uncharacterized protein